MYNIIMHCEKKHKYYVIIDDIVYVCVVWFVCAGVLTYFLLVSSRPHPYS